MNDKSEYQKRRQELALKIPANSLAIIPSAHEKIRNGDATYRFRQDSDFFYLTGFNEPNAVLLITSGGASESFLFNQPRNPLQEQWTGERLGQEDACEKLGIQAAYSIESFNHLLAEFIANQDCLCYPMGRYPKFEKRIHQIWREVKEQARRGIQSPHIFCDISSTLGEMRLFKSPHEIAIMKQAAQISVAAHQRAINVCYHTDFEYQLEAELIYEFARQGCRSVAYDPIVASGNNACVLHYTENNNPLRKGELVLIDAGGEFENYAADITRTFPASGKFSHEQRLIYELVLRAQKAGIACIQPGLPWNKVQETMVQILTEGLVDLDILQGSVQELIEKGAYKQFYMHNSGHWLGLDVHDAGSYKVNGQWRNFQPGMALTVEPGLYIHKDLENVDSRWLGIGVRIEDDIYVTNEGHVNLTGSLSVEADELEAMVRG